MPLDFQILFNQNSMNRKIVSRIVGGLGNQLFIYAASRRLALANSSELVLDDVSGFVNDSIYHRFYQLDHFNIPCRKATPAERFEPFSRVRRTLKRRLNQRLPFAQRAYLVQEGIDFDPRVLNLNPHYTLYLEGYWQSQNYFESEEAAIRKDLQIIPPKDADNQVIAKKIRTSTAVAMHVRFFDPYDGTGSYNTPLDYYNRAIFLMEQMAPRAHYYIFSDQIQKARSLISLPDDRFTLVYHNQSDDLAYADLWLMSQCHHFIIANSTFSWWGAWLARNKAKQVIAPGFEVREGTTAWGFKGLLPDHWIKL